MKIWAKARRNKEYPHEIRWHSLEHHSLDVAACAEKILEKNPWIKKVIKSHFMKEPDGSEKKAEELSTLLIKELPFLISLHDIGKILPEFQAKCDILCGDDKTTKKYVNKEKIDETHAEHTKTGEIILKYYFKTSRCKLIEAITNHHGYPRGDEINNAFPKNEIEKAEKHIKNMLFLIPNHFFLNFDIPDSLTWFISGLVILSDWMGSNEEYFPLRNGSYPESYCNYYSYALEQAERFINDACLYECEPSKIEDKDILQELFSINEGRPLQNAVINLELKDKPGIFFIEDLPGAGKTEAVIALAYRLMKKGLGNGFYFALPTGSTSNAIAKRINGFYKKLYKIGSKPSFSLNHSSARNFLSNYNLDYNMWQSSDSRQAMLSHIGVGTIDQALFSINQEKHATLRQFSLAGKILIIDEIHSFDAYTNEYIKNLIKFHSMNGGIVICLSATMTKQLKEDFLAAYQGEKSSFVEKNDKKELEPFPLITVWQKSDNEVKYITEGTAFSKTYNFEPITYDKVDKIIKKGLKTNQKILWIRNTVSLARKAYLEYKNDDLFKDKQDRIMLVHSRFTKEDRSNKEKKLLENFGSDSKRENIDLVIGTQVLEQSLDVDFDIIISDLAPADYIIQRAGRQHRHVRAERPADCIPTFYIVTPETDPSTLQEDEKWYGGANFENYDLIYNDPLTILRTSQILHDRKEFPRDIREIIETIYNPKKLGSDIDFFYHTRNITIRNDNNNNIREAINNMLDKKLYYSDKKAWQNINLNPGVRLVDKSTALRLYSETGLTPLNSTSENSEISVRDEGNEAWLNKLDYNMMKTTKSTIKCYWKKLQLTTQGTCDIDNINIVYNTETGLYWEK